MARRCSHRGRWSRQPVNRQATERQEVAATAGSSVGPRLPPPGGRMRPGTSGKPRATRQSPASLGPEAAAKLGQRSRQRTKRSRRRRGTLKTRRQRRVSQVPPPPLLEGASTLPLPLPPLATPQTCAACLQRCMPWLQQPQQAQQTAAAATLRAEPPPAQPCCSARQRWQCRRRHLRLTRCRSRQSRPRRVLGPCLPSQQPKQRARRLRPGAQAEAPRGASALLQAAAERAERARLRSAAAAAARPGVSAAASAAAQQSAARLRPAGDPRRLPLKPAPRPRRRCLQRRWPRALAAPRAGVAAAAASPPASSRGTASIAPLRTRQGLWMPPCSALRVCACTRPCQRRHRRAWPRQQHACLPPV